MQARARLALLALAMCVVSVTAADPPGTVDIKLTSGKSVKGVLLIGTIRIKTDVGTLDVNTSKIQAIAFSKEGDTITTVDGAAKGQILTTEFKVRVPLGLLTVNSDTIASMTFAPAPVVKPPVKVGQQPPSVPDVPAENQLTPLATIDIDGNVTGLTLTPDGKYLLLLNQTKGKLLRFDLAARKLDGTAAEVTAGTEGMGLTKKGDLLYTYASPNGHNAYRPKVADVGKVQIFTSPGLQLKKTIAFDFDPCGMGVHDAGYLFFTNGSNQWTTLGRLNVAKEEVERIRTGVRHRSILRMSPDQQRLYWSSTDISPGRIECLVLPPLGASAPDKEIEQLIAKLRSDNFGEREDATRALEKIGESAIPALKKALESDDIETRNRARRVLDQVEGQKKGTQAVSYKAPYHGTHPLGGRFEIAADGQHVICTGGCVLTAGREPDKDLRFVAKIEPHVVSCHGKEDKLVFVATRRNTLILYAYPSFEVKRTLLLKGSPREMIYDEVSRTLHAFVPQADGKSGQLHIYDLGK
ncbi:MAG: hypothetical protein AB7K24_05050 [Gemmataceae bacterium]